MLLQRVHVVVHRLERDADEFSRFFRSELYLRVRFDPFDTRGEVFPQIHEFDDFSDVLRSLLLLFGFFFVGVLVDVAAVVGVRQFLRDGQ